MATTEERREALQGEISEDGGVVFRSRQGQLSFNVGMRSEPDFGSVKVKGDMPIARDLAYGLPVEVRIVGLDGEVLAAGRARVGLPAFREHTDKWGNVSFERAHTVELVA